VLSTRLGEATDSQGLW